MDFRNWAKHSENLDQNRLYGFGMTQMDVGSVITSGTAISARCARFMYPNSAKGKIGKRRLG